MAELTRNPPPMTAQEAEELLKAGKLAAANITPAAEAPPDGEAPKLIPRGFSVRLKGLSDSEAEVTLTDGRKVTLKNPNAATQFVQDRILKAYDSEPGPNGYGIEITMMVRSLMYLSAIDGKSVSRPTDYVETQALMNQLGDEGVDAVKAAYFKHWVEREVQLPS